MPTSPQTRVLELLTEARRALSLKSRLQSAGKDSSAVDAALEGLYLDLGRAMVTAAEADGGLVLTALRPPEAPDYELDMKESWYSDEVDRPPGPREVGPLFDPEDLDQATDIPLSEFDESTPVIPPEREYTDSEVPKDYVVATVAGLAHQAALDPESPVALLRNTGQADPEWRKALSEYVGLLVLPNSFADADQLGEESSRLQWAVSELDKRIGGVPAEIRAAVLGLLGARAQHLRKRLDSDVGPRLLLDRLQRYRIEHNLPNVAALLPVPRPEHATWEEDARRWWTLLRTGYSTHSAEALSARG